MPVLVALLKDSSQSVRDAVTGCMEEIYLVVGDSLFSYLQVAHACFMPFVSLIACVHTKHAKHTKHSHYKYTKHTKHTHSKDTKHTKQTYIHPLKERMPSLSAN